jgi:mercuric ion transport protein
MIGIEQVLDKIGIGGIVFTALGCAACFSALVVLTATLGLGFLGQLEGTITNALLPLFALIIIAMVGTKIKFIGEAYYLELVR